MPYELPTMKIHGNEAHNPDMLPLDTSSAIDAYMSGNKWLSVSTSGIVGLPRQSACWAYLSASQNIPSGTSTLVEFDGVLYDRQNEFDTTNHRFVATEGGLYLVVAQLTWKGSTIVTDKAYEVIVSKNGVRSLRADGHSAIAASLTTKTMGIIPLDTGDYLEVYAYHTAESNVDLLENSSDTFFIVAKIA